MLIQVLCKLNIFERSFHLQNKTKKSCFSLAVRVPRHQALPEVHSLGYRGTGKPAFTIELTFSILSIDFAQLFFFILHLCFL